MRYVVMGGTGHIGRLVVGHLERAAQAVVVASRAHGVDSSTGRGLAAALDDADVVIDVTDSSHRVVGDAHEFFARSTGRLLDAEQIAGPDAGHHRSSVA